MENQIYRVELSPDSKVEFYVGHTNEVEPYKPILDLGIVVFDKNNLQLDASLDLNQLDSLVKYITECRDYISKFNHQAKEVLPGT